MCKPQTWRVCSPASARSTLPKLQMRKTTNTNVQVEGNWMFDHFIGSILNSLALISTVAPLPVVSHCSRCNCSVGGGGDSHANNTHVREARPLETRGNQAGRRQVKSPTIFSAL